MTGWQDHADKDGNFVTCEGIEGPQPIVDDPNGDESEESSSRSGKAQ